MSSLALEDSGRYFAEKIVGDDDFDSLDQGPKMTAVRHEFVCRHLVGSKKVLDYGCGTGLILENPSFPGGVQEYLGVDFEPSRKAKFADRALAKGLFNSFTLVPVGRTYEWFIQGLMRDHAPDTVVLCGVLGYQGFTDLKSVVEAFQYNGRRKLIMTVPVVTPDYDEQVIHRFQESEVPGTVERLHPGLLGVVC